jgi:hypothetical protein
MTDQAIDIWIEALDDVLWCIPPEIREQVLVRLLEKERNRKPLEIVRIGELDADEFRNYHAEMEAVSLMVQVLTRSITNNFSKEDAAKVLFREHRRGTGSGWLPDYLDGLPGIEVDKATCAAIADLAGPSELREAMFKTAKPGAVT